MRDAIPDEIMRDARRWASASAISHSEILVDAMTDTIARALMERDKRAAAEIEANDEEWRESLQSEYARVERHKNRAEAADAEIARLRDAIAEKDKALEPFARMADELENEPAWRGVLEHDHPLAGRVNVSDFRRAYAARRAHGGQADG